MSKLLTALTSLTATGFVFCLVDCAAAEMKPADQAWKREISLYAGSKSCIECHGKFYQLWSTSRHGLAMQPIPRDPGSATLRQDLWLDLTPNLT